MTTTHRNRLVTSVSAVASAGLGDFTISTASTNYRSFVAGDDGLSFDVVIAEGTTWEVRTGCVYTHSGTSLARGTLEDSSTGSAITFTTAAVVTATPTAAFLNRLESAALNQVALADANTTMVVGTMYVGSMAAWATADRTYTLPTNAAVGDRIGVMITGGNASYELILTAGTSDTLNGVAGGTEWSRLFITNEVIIMRCVTANSAWVVEQDGRIPQQAGCRLTTSASAEVAATVTTPTDKSGVWTAYMDNASLTTIASSDIKTRRAGNFLASMSGVSTSNVTSGKYFSTYLYKNGTTDIAMAGQFVQGAAINGRVPNSTALIVLAADDYLKYRWRSEEGSKGLLSSADPALSTAFSIVEVL